ncbi:hypothetical protein AB5I41_10895 [Sphingomonas sp. MMS24-JH45]
MLIDINDNQYLPASYSDKPFTVYADATIDGNLVNWVAADRLDRAGSVPDGVSIYGHSNGDFFDFALYGPTRDRREHDGLAQHRPGRVDGLSDLRFRRGRGV